MLLPLCLSSFILFINLFIEFRLIYVAWQFQNREFIANGLNHLKKRLFIFYLIFHFSLFICILNIKYIFSNPIVILLLTSVIWLPQILQNHFTPNPKHPPFAYMIVTSMSRSFLFVYNKSVEKKTNLLHIHPESYVVALIILMLAFQHLIIIFQVKYGSNVLWCIRRQSVVRAYSLKYFDSLEKETNLSNCECMICLNQLKQGDFSYNSIKDVSTESMSNLNLSDSCNEHNQHFQDKNFKQNLNETMKLMLSYLKASFAFSSLRRENTQKYVMTSCGHIFHSLCLRGWLKEKHQCPIDRKDLILNE